MEILVVGAGLSGAVIARELASEGHRVTVRDARDHIAGNCHTARDPATGVMVHVYGPHIFHTDDEEVWRYVNNYGEFRRYTHRVKATAGGKVYSLPVNLHTINQLFDCAMGPNEARAFIAAQTDKSITERKSFEDQALSSVGARLYESFLKGYTQKQWGRSPSELPASILKRLPVRFSYDDNYFFHKFQGIPVEGYTHVVGRMLDHPAISVELGKVAHRSETADFDHVFCSGSIDQWFGHVFGRLGYRTLEFERFICDGDYLGCAVMNYPDCDVPYTRITEHKHFAPWEDHAQSVCYREFPRECTADNIPYYPIRLLSEKHMLRKYVEVASELENTTFVGRLGTYRYLDMDVCIREALNTARLYVECISRRRKMCVFYKNPIGNA